MIVHHKNFLHVILLEGDRIIVRNRKVDAVAVAEFHSTLFGSFNE